MARCTFKDGFHPYPQCIYEEGHACNHMFGNDYVPAVAQTPYAIVTKGIEATQYTLPGGATRSEKAPPYHLVPMEGLRRTALRYGLGAEKHGAEGWKKSCATKELAHEWCLEAYSHMMEHIRKMISGLEPEDDHLGAIGWAQHMFCYVEELHKCKWTDLLKENEK